MIEVELPDGSIAEFPDGTPPEAMKSALSKRVAAAQPAPPAAQRNPDGTYGQPPEGMFENPNTGQMTSRDMLKTQIAPTRLGAFITGGARGSALGWEDELVGALSSATGGDGEFNKELTRAEFEANRDAYPGTSLGGELVGGTASSILASRLGLGGSVPTVRGAAVAGATESALAGAGSGEGVRDRVIQALTGGVLGAGLGAVVGKLGQIARPASEIDNVGASQSPADIVGKTREGLGLGAPSKEASGMNLRDAIVSDQDRLYRSGQKQVSEALAGDAAIGGKSFTPVKKEVEFAYPEVREKLGKTPIMINQNTTPTAFAIKQLFDKIPGDQPLTLAGYDQFRREAKAIAKSASNATDRAAAQDFLEAVDTSVGAAFKSNKTSSGDPALYDAYVAGREVISNAMKAKNHKKIAELIDDQTIPGSVIADELLSLGTKTGKRNAASAAARIRETLGEDSASMQTLRNGVLDQLLVGDGSEASVKKLVSTIEDNREMLGEIFTPDQLDALNKLPVELTNAISAGAAKSSPVVASLFTRLLNDERAGKAIAEFMRKNRAPLGAMSAGIAGGVAGGGIPHAAAAWLAAKGVSKALSYRPVRSAVSSTLDTVGTPISRMSAVGAAPAVSEDISERANIMMKSDEELMREYQQKTLMGGN